MNRKSMPLNSGKIRQFFTLFFIISTSVFAQNDSLTIRSIYTNYDYYPQSLHGVHWLQDGTGFTWRIRNAQTGKTDFQQYTIRDGRESVFLSGAELDSIAAPLNLSSKTPVWSADRRYVLFTGTTRARRTKTSGNITVFDRRMKSIQQIAQSQQEQKIVRFSPDGTKIGFVRGDDIYVYTMANSDEKRLTFDGAEFVHNGHFDWVYEEEFSVIDGWRWSPDSRHIAYWQVDDSAAPEFKISGYDSLYLNFNYMHYPKAGGVNATVRIGVVDVNNGTQKWMDIGNETDIYIPRIYWLDKNSLLILRLNRLQNNLDFLKADVASGKTTLLFSENDDRWIDIEDDLYVLKNGTAFVFSSDRDGFRHIYLYDIRLQKTTQLTKGKWDVRSVDFVDKKSRMVWFTAARPTPMEAQVFAVAVSGGAVRQVTTEPGWHSATISPGGEYFIDTYSNLTEVPITELKSENNKVVKRFVSNDELREKVASFSKPRFFTFKTSDGQSLNGWVLKPADFDKSKKYPLFMYVYGGPGSQTVRNRWGTVSAWHQLLAQQGYVVISVDNRGTGARGAEFKKIVYKNLGKWEVNDQVEAAKYMASQPWIDASRIGIFGWSYGGYMSSLCLLKGNDVFKTAVAVAPVTDWRFYDTIYTERYMQTPQLNPEGYAAGAPVNYADSLRGNFLLVHGMADDNVHFQNSVVLVDKLIAANKQFQTMYYPGRYHGIRGRSRYTREHLFTMITNFLLKNL